MELGVERRTDEAPHLLSSRAPRRPLLVLAAVLLAGTELGLATTWHGNALAGLLLGAIVATSRPRTVPRASWLALAALFTLVLLRAQATCVPVARPDPDSKCDAGRLRASREVHVGRFRELAPGRGWLEEERGRAPTLLYELDDTRVADGDWIAVPGDVERVPWPRGRRLGAMASRFPDGRAPLLADEVLRLGGRSDRAPLGSSSQRESGIAGTLESWRTRLGERADALFAPRVAGIARALLTGDRSTLDPELTDLFTRTGTRHLLAVSGLHVALTAWLFLVPLASLVERLLGGKTGRRVGGLLFGGLLFAFAHVAGLGAPVVRAAVALALAALARRLPGRRGSPVVLGRSVDALSLWALALVLELLADARATRSLSVQLSYLATFGILVGTRPLAATLSRLAAAIPGRPRLPAAPLDARIGVWWRAPLGRIARSARVGVAASTSAVLATLPVVWAQFGEFSSAGVLATLLALPLFVAAMGSLWAAALTGVGAVFVPVANASLSLLLRLLELVDRLPATPFSLPARPAALVAVATFATLAALASRSALLRRMAALGFGALLVPWCAAPRGLELELLDVGHGCALLVRAPGEPCLLFDGGSRDRRPLYREAIAPQLARWEVGRPTVVLTHEDRDHASGLAELVERHPPRAWLGELPAPIAERLPSDCARLDLPRGRLSLCRASGPLTLELFRGDDLEGNEGSRALLLGFGRSRVLLFGDAEGAGLRALLDRNRRLGPVDLLLLPHHGSETLWLAALLRAARPRRIWVSAATDPALARELDRRKLDWTVTSRAGPLSLELGPDRPLKGRLR